MSPVMTQAEVILKLQYFTITMKYCSPHLSISLSVILETKLLVAKVQSPSCIFGLYHTLFSVLVA